VRGSLACPPSRIRVSRITAPLQRAWARCDYQRQAGEAALQRRQISARRCWPRARLLSVTARASRKPGDAQTDGTFRYQNYPWGWFAWQVYARKHVPMGEFGRAVRPTREHASWRGESAFSARFPVDLAQLPDVAFVIPGSRPRHAQHRRLGDLARGQFFCASSWAPMRIGRRRTTRCSS
jgi:hypothetical protein